MHSHTYTHRDTHIHLINSNNGDDDDESFKKFSVICEGFFSEPLQWYKSKTRGFFSGRERLGLIPNTA